MNTNIFNFTFIIPHYNIPNLLMRCLKSIPEREDIQVIVIDDCSPDADTYMSRFPELSRANLEFYSTTKGGSAGRARNVGLDHAKGKWLLFADSDDFFVKEIEEFLEKYLDAEEDVIYYNYDSVMSDDITKPSGRDLAFKKYFTNFSENEPYFRCLHASPWGKMVRRQLVDLNNIRFDETRWTNDYFFSVNVGLKAKKIKVVDQVLYYLTERTGSLCYKFCDTLEELKVRSEVVFRTQGLIAKSPYYYIDNNIVYFLKLQYRRDKRLFKYYFKKLDTIGMSKTKTARKISRGFSKKQKIIFLTFIFFKCFL